MARANGAAVTGPVLRRWEIGGVLFDEAQRMVPQQPSVYRKPEPPLTIPDRNYYREYLERRANPTHWLSLGPFSINLLHHLESTMPRD